MHIGDIVMLNNIIFGTIYKNGKLINKKSVDYAFDCGRPCVYIGEYDENMYFISISNASENSKHLSNEYLRAYKNGLVKYVMMRV